MKSFIDTLLTAFAILLFIPTLLMLISWNAIPGNSLYPVKGWFEDVALAITIKTPLASMLSIKFTERRFSEANKLLAQKGSTLGYTLLVAEASQSKDIIVEKSDSKSADELIVKIEEIQKNLEEKKVAVATSPQSVANVPVTAIQTLPPIPTSFGPKPSTQIQPPSTYHPPVQQTIQPIFQPAPSPTPAPSTGQVIIDLETTNAELEKIKDELKNRVPHQFREGERDQGRGRDTPRGRENTTTLPPPTQIPTPTTVPTVTQTVSPSTATAAPTSAANQ